MKQLLANHPFVLMEASIVEQLRRSREVHLHETLANAPLIYDPVAREVMGALYKGFMKLALNARLPMLVCTPTWRANRERVDASGCSKSINVDAASYMQELCESVHPQGRLLKIGGMIGCRNDCYQPAEGLSVSDAKHFHAWQVEQLVEGGVDFLIAETLPQIQEARGLAEAMGSTGIPYIISFVISRDGCLLDGTGLDAAIDSIDSKTNQPPLGYMVNCAHPSFLCPEKQAGSVLTRLIGYQANASSWDHHNLDNADELQADSLPDWGDRMLELHHRYGVQVLGGCCGTNLDYLRYLVEHRSHNAQMD